MAISVSTDSQTLKAFIERRHPDYDRLAKHWKFLEDTYNGGREWFPANIFRYLKEGESEYKARLERAYRFNHTRETVDLVQKYIFKSKVVRNTEDAPQEVKDFWRNVTLSELDITEFMRLVSTLTSIFGRIWIFTDTNAVEPHVSVAEEQINGSRVYAYIVKPIDVLDMGFDDEGELSWVLVRELVRDDKDPITSTGNVVEQYRLWTTDEWLLFQEEKKGNKKIVVLLDRGVNALGKVPGFPVDHVIGENRYSAPGLINDIAYLDRAVANYLSNLDAIIQDQTFSQLAMPAQGMLPGDEKYNQLVEAGTKRIFIYDGEGGVAPHYLSPDPKQAGVIIDVVNKIIGEIYHTIGLAGERTKQDNAVGIDNSSGVAKAYDFERVNSLLASKAQSLENAENHLLELVLGWYGQETEVDLVHYPVSFDIRSLFDEFSIAEKLNLIAAPDLVRREQMHQVVEKLFPRLSTAKKAEVDTELKNWPAAVETPSGGSSNGIPQNARMQNRQGQVTSKTP